VSLAKTSGATKKMIIVIFSADGLAGKPEERVKDRFGEEINGEIPLSEEGVNEGVNELLTLIAKNPGKRTPFFQKQLNKCVSKNY
jgi:hypothetical protein